MRGLLAILFFLITTSISAQNTHEIKTQIGKSKFEIYQFMQANKAFELDMDTVLIDKGEVLRYKLKVHNDSIIYANRIITFTYYLSEGRCDGIRIIIYGSDSLTALVDKLNKHYRRAGVNVWIDEHLSIGVRIIELEPYFFQGGKLELYQVDTGMIDFMKH
jgi:hypothetical protein